MAAAKDSKTSATMSPNISGDEGNCPKCGCSLRVFGAEYRDENGALRYEPCPDCFPEEHEREKSRYTQIARQKRIERLLGESCLSPRFVSRTFENFDASGSADKKRILDECRRFAQEFPDRQRKGTWLAFMGPCGTGKGHLAAAVVREVIERHGATALFVKYHDLVRRIKHSWGPDAAESEERILKAVREVDLLVLDEIGVQFDTNAERLILYAVLDHRYEFLKPTILTTNLNLEQLERVAGERVVDRLHDQESGNKVFVFNWKSHRRK